MNWQNFIRGLVTSTLIFGGVLLFLTLFSSPEKGLATVIIYFVSLFFFVMGIAAISGFLFRKWWTHNEILFENVKISVRQSLLFSAFVIAVLLLSTLRLLVWWDAIILAFSFMLIELYFKTRTT